MNLRSLLTATCLTLSFLPTIAAEETRPPVKVEKAGKFTAVVGQPVHFAFKYDGFAGQIITGLLVTVDGKTVEKPRVESAADPNMVDVVVVTFIFQPEKAGTFQVNVTPVTGKRKGEPREHVLTVTAK